MYLIYFLQLIIIYSSAEVDIQPWDWRYYAEKVRQSSYNLDESEIKPYFPLDRMVEAIFDCAYELFGLRFTLRPDLVSYHPDVQTYEVRQVDKSAATSAGAEPEGQLVAIFLHDNYARQNKKSGAWMSEYRCQSRNNDVTGKHVIPIVVNNNNFNKPAPGEVALLSFDDARTLFHEFGHGLHGMLSNVTYQRLAGNVVDYYCYRAILFLCDGYGYSYNLTCSSTDLVSLNCNADFIILCRYIVMTLLYALI